MIAPADPVAEIRRLYYATSKQTILRDLARAIELLKQLPSDEERERAAVFMDGLAQMRSEWGVTGPPPAAGAARRGPRRQR
jgi:hypothetical protein